MPLVTMQLSDDEFRDLVRFARDKQLDFQSAAAEIVVAVVDLHARGIRSEVLRHARAN